VVRFFDIKHHKSYIIHQMMLDVEEPNRCEDRSMMKLPWCHGRRNWVCKVWHRSLSWWWKKDRCVDRVLFWEGVDSLRAALIPIQSLQKKLCGRLCSLWPMCKSLVDQNSSSEKRCSSQEHHQRLSPVGRTKKRCQLHRFPRHLWKHQRPWCRRKRFVIEVFGVKNWRKGFCCWCWWFSSVVKEEVIEHKRERRRKRRCFHVLLWVLDLRKGCGKLRFWLIRKTLVVWNLEAKTYNKVKIIGSILLILEHENKNKK